MLRSLTGRVLLASLLPLIIAVLTLGLFLGLRFEAYHLDRMHTDLEHEAELMARLLAPDLAGGRPDSVAALVAELARSRPGASVVVANAAGAAIASEPARDPSGRDAANTDTELRQALGGQILRHRGNSFSPEGMFVVLPIRNDGVIVGALHLAYDVEHVAALTRELRLSVFLAAAAAATAAGFVALALSRSVTRPIAALARAATRLADGHLDERAPLPPTIELGALASAFNHLAARLQALEAARREFLADVSHEIRAPVGAIQAALETLQAGAVAEPEYRDRLIAGTVGEVQRLSRVTADLLELARFETGRLDLRRQPTPVAPLLCTVAAGFEGDAAERRIELAIEVPPDLPTIQLDPDRIGQVLRNLLTNALKYTPSAGRVVVRARADATHVAFAVSDTGPGISIEDLPRLFDRFYRGGGGQTRQPGLGLGLAIAKALVEAHGGRIGVESYVGVGTTFTVLIPRDGTPQSLPSL